MMRARGAGELAPAICPSGKRTFRSERDARSAHRKAGYRIRVYRCDDCRFYHVTSHEKAGAAREDFA